MVTIDDNRATVRRFYEVMDSGDAAVINQVLDEIAHPEFELKTPLPSDARGVDAVKQLQATLRRAFPDLRHDLQEFIAEDDKVVVRCANSGTHKGDYLGLPPTGKTFEMTELMIFRFAPDGRILGIRGLVDIFSVLLQLGVAPAGLGQPAQA